jgi:hypothetical protein
MPKTLLKNLGHDSKAINDLANLTFIGGKSNRNISNKMPSEYLNDLFEKKGEVIFTDNYIPNNKKLCDILNYNSFLDHRQSLITAEFNSFFKKYELE